MKKLLNKLKIYLKPFCSPKFLVSYGTAWMITNGWSYLFVIIGPIVEWSWMTAIGAAYQAFIWSPIGPEKLITIPLSIWFHTLLFKRDDKTHLQLENMYAEAKKDWNSIKSKIFKRRKK